MPWEAWVLVVILLLGMFMCIGSIGKPRKPLTSDVAVGVLMIGIFELFLVLRLGGAL